MPNDHANSSWKGPTIRDIAEMAGVGPATVDRVLNNRPGVRERTRQRVIAALEKLSTEVQDGQQRLDLRLFCDSGETFNKVLADATVAINRSVSGAAITGHYVSTSQLEPEAFARKMVEDGLSSDGVLLVAREHPAINRAVRRLRSEDIPVICLTTDLPSSRRSAYVGND